MAQWVQKRCSIPPIIRELQIKTIMRFHLTAVKWPSLKSPQITNTGEGVEKGESSYTVDGTVKGAATMEVTLDVP